MASIADSNTYKQVHMIHHFKGFSKDHVVFPLFVPQEIFLNMLLKFPCGNYLSKNVPFNRKLRDK